MMNNSITYRFGAILLLAAALAGCSKEPGEPAPADGTEITLTASLPGDLEAEAAAGEDATAREGIPAAKALPQIPPFCFARNDQNASGVYGGYAATYVEATARAGSGNIRTLDFAEKQYYQVNGKSTKLAGWRPGGAAAAGDATGKGYYDATAQTVSWQIDGTQDILTATAREGSIKNPLLAFTFGHALAQVNIWLYAEDAGTADAWGKVTKIEILRQQNACVYNLAADDATGIVTGTGAADQALPVNRLLIIPLPVGVDNIQRKGNPVMIVPQSDAGYMLQVRLTAEAGTLTATVPAQAYPAGSATNIRLKVTRYGLIPSATIGEWAAPVDQDMTSADGLATLYYGDAAGNGGVTTDLSGSTEVSYNGYTPTGNGTKYASYTDAYAGEKGYARLQVAPSDEGAMSWTDAYAACRNKTADGRGWRLPRMSELRLIDNNQASLESQPGFTAFTANKYYWSGTESTTTNLAYLIRISDHHQNADHIASPGYLVRCVREVATTSGYPYVTDGKIVVSMDFTGSSGAAVHPFWTAASMPAHNEKDAVNNAVAMRLEVAAADVSGTPTLAEAKSACAGYAPSGSSAGDWRLPTQKELLLIYAVKGSLTASTFVDNNYWSGTGLSSDNNRVQGVNLSTGTCGTCDIGAINYARCVRDLGAPGYPYVTDGKIIVSQDAYGYAGQPIHPDWTAASMPAHNEKSPYNAVAVKFEVAHDNLPGMMNWTDALAGCAGYSQAGSSAGDWRLPTIKELLLIYAQKSALTGITTLAGYNYWSGTEYSTFSEAVWYVSYSGGAYTDVKSNDPYYVRCVRDVK